ncbi:MAG: DNA repair protein RecO [Candidatus Handelsmanbacteria bacterium]|nr:DNA repair protein RecO [Candidatus Handelsmanbacteria bacterium]
MPSRIVKTRAVVLRARRLGETSKLLTLYTEDEGKLRATAKGARKPKSRFGGALEWMTEVQVVCYLRDERDLQTLSDGDALRAFPRLLGDLERLSLGSAACELIDRLTVERDPNRRLYRCLSGVLAGLEEVQGPQVEPLFWYFQLRAAEALGYRPELDHCTSCRLPLAGEWLWFSPAMGGGLCARCGTAAGGIRVAGDSLRLLAGLQALGAYQPEAIPPAPPRRGELRSMLRRFLEYHGGQHSHLKSLDFLEAVK